ncbi:MAG: GntR family transcriptional regulator [Caulobacter sp.]|nr:GntR family transcriptional regulator [Caulobacter sp.]
MEEKAQLARISRETQQERVFRELSRGLLAGVFAPGEVISIRALCFQLGAGAMPVRESVQRLVGQGALEALPNRTLRVPEMTADAFEELMRLRAALEPMAAGLAAESADAEDSSRFHALHIALEQAVRGRHVGEALKLNTELHFAIYRAAGAPLLASIIEGLWLRLGPLLRVIFSSPDVLDSIFEQIWTKHSDLDRALAGRDAAGAQAALAQIIALTDRWFAHNHHFIEGEQPLSTRIARRKDQ